MTSIVTAQTVENLTKPQRWTILGLLAVLVIGTQISNHLLRSDDREAFKQAQQESRDAMVKAIDNQTEAIRAQTAQQEKAAEANKALLVELTRQGAVQSQSTANDAAILRELQSLPERVVNEQQRRK